jgi:hypothetical protein
MGKQERSELEETIAVDPEDALPPPAESYFRQGPLTLDDLKDGEGCCEDDDWDD